MDSARWNHIKYFFVMALEQRPEDRSRFLQQRCRQADVRDEVERLLAAHEASSGFLERPAAEELGATPLEICEAPTLPPGSELGPYRVVELLGAGGMGEVYRARDPRLDREIALKVLPVELTRTRELMSRFRREARAAASLSHPNICTIYEFGEAAGHLYIAMEFVEGETLRERLARTRFSVDDVVSIGIQLTDALEAARRRGVVHRDIKPANIVITDTGTAKILDFGLAKQQSAGMSTTGTSSVLTHPGMILGTVAYMAPEQAAGSPVDHRCDLYSLGVVLYELLTGRQPFEGRSYVDVLQQVISSPPPDSAQANPAVPEALSRIVTKLLQKDPVARYQTAHAVRTDLQRLNRPSVDERARRATQE